MSLETFFNILLFGDLADEVDKISRPESKPEITEKKIYLLCDETMVRLRLLAEKRESPAQQKLTCEILEIDGEILNPGVKESFKGRKNSIITGETAKRVTMMTLKRAGLSTEKIVLATDRYAESRRKILRLKKSIAEGGSND